MLPDSYVKPTTIWCGSHSLNDFQIPFKHIFFLEFRPELFVNVSEAFLYFSANLFRSTIWQDGIGA